jgi:3-phenylpropionate/trans-cinnamate dioxygenase ferredoxin subunit
LIRIASIHEIPPVGEVRRFEVDGEEIAIVNTGDHLHAINDICSHEHYHLSDGEVDLVSCTIECPKHGSAFDLETGRPTSLPAVLPVKTYAVQVVGEDVMVEVMDGVSGQAAQTGG